MPAQSEIKPDQTSQEAEQIEHEQPKQDAVPPEKETSLKKIPSSHIAQCLFFLLAYSPPPPRRKRKHCATRQNSLKATQFPKQTHYRTETSLL